MSMSLLLLEPSHLRSAQWIYQSLAPGTNSESQFLRHLETVKSQWTSEKVHIPEEWMNPSKPMYGRPRCIQVLNSLWRIRDMVSPLTMEAQQIRSDSFTSHCPDFFLAACENGGSDTPFETAVVMTTLLNFFRLQFIIFLTREPLVREPRGRCYSAGHMAQLLSQTLEDLPGFILKTGICNGCSEDRDDQSEPASFGLLVRQYGSKPEYLWDRSPSPRDSVCFRQLQAVADSMRISDTHPAVILGITNDADTDEPALHELARLIAPSLDAVLRTWRMRQRQRNESLEPPPWLILFGLVITPDTISVVAHYPAIGTADSSVNLCCSCVVDKIPYHPDICWQSPSYDLDPSGELPEAWQGPVDDSDVWIRDRLRLFIAMQTIVKNARRVAAIWDDIFWSAEYFAAEDALEKRHAEWDTPTPSPSDGDPDPDYNPFGFDKSEMMIWAERLDEILVDDEPSDPEVERERAQKNREKVLAWREKIQL